MRRAPGAVGIATWNMEWKQPGSPASQLMMTRLAEISPDIVCFTEAYDTVTSGGHLIVSDADYGYPLTPGRRKVMLWSREPWQEVDATGHAQLPPGRFIAGRTATPVGPVTVLGVCIPWREAHVRSGRRDRRPWDEHLAYLNAVAEIVRVISGPAILIGDFNQRIPRVYTPEAVHQALLDALTPKLTVLTQGPIGPDGQVAIDHIAHTSEFTGEGVCTLSNIGPDGERLSDHFGVAARLLPSA